MTKTVTVPVDELKRIRDLGHYSKQRDALDALIPKPRTIATFSLYTAGKPTNGLSTTNLTAEQWGSTFYGAQTVARLQAELDADPYSHSEGEMHTTIPDNTNGANDTYGRRYSVLIESITLE